MSSTFLESNYVDLEKTVTNKIRAALGVGGLLALVIGVVILFWPVKTAVVVAGIIAFYAALAGIVNISIAVFSRHAGTWPRVGYGALGVAFFVAAIVAFMNLRGAAAALGTVIGIVVGIVWIAEGIVGLTMIGNASSKLWAVIYAGISLIAGVVVMTSPIWGATMLWLLLGVSLVILGAVQLIRAFRFGQGSSLPAVNV